MLAACDVRVVQLDGPSETPIFASPIEDRSAVGSDPLLEDALLLTAVGESNDGPRECGHM